MILRVRVCIPTFDNPASVSGVVLDCLKLMPFPVLVVDDGSKVPVESLLREPEQLDALGSGRLKIIRLPSNQGKGSALQAAFRDSIEKSFTHVLAIDADGQHLVGEAWKLVRAAQENPWDLVIGNRKLGGGNVPEVSRFGRKFSNFWVGFQTDAKVADSQSGLRVYPLFQLQGCRWFTRRFDFEIEVLIRMLWKGVGVKEVEVDVFYPEPKDRVSHFHKFRDNVRISCLNTVLVAISLLRSYGTPRRIGFDVGLGVLIGCTPFIGFHSAIAAAVALGFRSNFIALWLGTQISLPPLMPLLIYFSSRIGERITGLTATHGSREFAENWLVGSIPLGLALGTIIGLAVFLGCSAYRSGRARRESSWNGRTRGGKFGNFFLISIARRLGLKTTYFVLRFIIPYFYLFAPKARSAANEYWRAIRPDAGWLTRQALIHGQLFRFAQVLIDRIYQGFHPESKFRLNAVGIANILDPLRAGEGLILLSAHVGGWDLAGAALPWDGFRGDLKVVRYESPEITLEKVRNQPDPEHLRKLVINETSSSTLRIRQALEEGKAVALMGDRPLGPSVELVTFLGRLAPLDSTPFRIASACTARLLFTFGFKAPDAPATYDLYATPSRGYGAENGENRRVQCLLDTAEYARELERLVRRYPEQWFNFYRLFSTVPQAPSGVEAAPARAHLKEELHRPPTPATGSEAARRASASPESPR